MGSAQARRVFLNGVEVEQLANKSFPSCEVRFDADGNVWIQAKGYAVKVDGAPGAVQAAPAPAPGAGPVTEGGKPSKRYWIVATQPRVGAAQYDIEVFVNGKLARKVRSKDSHTALEITANLALGRNVIHFAASKNYGGGKRFSSSPEDTFTVIVGEGVVGQGSVTITSPLARMVRSAAEVRSFASDVTITTR